MNPQSQTTGQPTLRKPEVANSTVYIGEMLEPPAPVHPYEHEISSALEGEIEFFVEGEPKSFLADPGDTADLPRCFEEAIDRWLHKLENETPNDKHANR